jgi:nucleoside-diphosphate-sugar epimerase
MRVVVIGGTGHIGSYFSPRLVEAGCDVTCVSRGIRKPYQEHEAWKRIGSVVMDRTAEELKGSFGQRIAALGADVVVDLTCYTVESARQLVDALRGRTSHFLHCGTIWVHGARAGALTTEGTPREPFGDYGCRKAAIERMLLDESRSNGFPATIVHPGHLVGPGWAPINPAGNFNPGVFSNLASGREVALPNAGVETVHHVHADDVAQVFARAVAARSASIGESFHAVSPSSLKLRDYAEAMARWFGGEPRLRFLAWEEWRTHVSEKDAQVTWDHITHSPNCSIAKARTRLGYEPRYGSLDAVRESVTWLMKHGIVQRRLETAPGGNA